MAAGNAVLLGLLFVPVAFAEIGQAAVDFLEGLRDVDRVFYEARKVSLEMVVREADVLLQTCLQLDRTDD